MSETKPKRAPCPWCGHDTPRIEWTIRGDLLALVAACTRCGAECPTAVPLPYLVTEEGPGWPAGAPVEGLLTAIDQAWESWDSAWHWKERNP